MNDLKELSNAYDKYIRFRTSKVRDVLLDPVKEERLFTSLLITFSKVYKKYDKKVINAIGMEDDEIEYLYRVAVELKHL